MAEPKPKDPKKVLACEQEQSSAADYSKLHPLPKNGADISQEDMEKLLEGLGYGHKCEELRRAQD